MGEWIKMMVIGIATNVGIRFMNNCCFSSAVLFISISGWCILAVIVTCGLELVCAFVTHSERRRASGVSLTYPLIACHQSERRVGCWRMRILCIDDLRDTLYDAVCDLISLCVVTLLGQRKSNPMYLPFVIYPIDIGGKCAVPFVQCVFSK